jgi:hypothetical protein
MSLHILFRCDYPFVKHKERVAVKCFTLFHRKEMINTKVCNTKAKYLLQKNWLSATHCIFKIVLQSEGKAIPLQA